MDRTVLSIAIVVAVVVVLGPMATGLIHDIKRIFASEYCRDKGLVMRTAMILSIITTFVLLALEAAGGYDFKDIFGLLERAMMFVFILLCVWYVLLRIRTILYWLSMTPLTRVLLALLMLPVSIAAAYLASKYIGFPIFRAVDNVLNDFIGVAVDKESMNWLSFCLNCAVAAGAITWGLTARYAIRPLNCLLLLPVYAIMGAAAGFVVYGFLAWLLLSVLFGTLGWGVERFGRIHDRAYEAMMHYPVRDEVLREIAMDIAKSPWVWLGLMGRNNDEI